MAGTLITSTIQGTTLTDGTNSTSTTNCIQGSAKAWVNFNGTGTVAIRASYNVSSITDNGTGDYTVNFTNALPDANYSITGSAMHSASVNAHVFCLGDVNGASGTLPSTTAVRFRTMYLSGPVAQDCTYVCVAVHD
jgi:hypothetical protein